jgi:hypothetical protein
MAANPPNFMAKGAAPIDASLLTEADTLPWAPVTSTNIVAIAYNPATSRLFVRFHAGTIYAYDNVPLGIFQGFVASSSKGQYLWRVIRNLGADNLYPHKQVT